MNRPQMTNLPREVRVTFRKAVSDGNFGTESAEVTLQEWLTDDYDVDEAKLVAERLLAEARMLAHDQLALSPSVRVRDALKLGRRDPDARMQPVTSGAAADDF